MRNGTDGPRAQVHIQPEKERQREAVSVGRGSQFASKLTWGRSDDIKQMAFQEIRKIDACMAFNKEDGDIDKADVFIERMDCL